MGKKDKEHRKKVQARNQKLKREESTLINLFKKLEESKKTETENKNQVKND
jgi:methylthioribose-1-phosphate isomerase